MPWLFRRHIRFHNSVVLNILILVIFYVSIPNLLDYMKFELKIMFLPYLSHFLPSLFPVSSLISESKSSFLFPVRNSS